MVMPHSTAAGTSSKVPFHHISSSTSFTMSPTPRYGAMKRVISASGLASYIGSMHFSDRRTVRICPSGTTSSYSYISQAGSRMSA